MQVILASQSPYRRAQLERFGLPFLAQAPKAQEEQLKKQGPTDLVELTRFLALEKAKSLTSMFPEAIVIGSDQMAEFQGQRMDKPGSREKAFEQLRRLSGQSHRLITSVAVVSPKGTEIATEITELHLRKVQDDFLRKYIEQDNPVDCAGAYKIERAGLALIESVRGQDPSAIEGLPLIGLTHCLTTLGYAPEQLWRKQ